MFPLNNLSDTEKCGGGGGGVCFGANSVSRNILAHIHTFPSIGRIYPEAQQKFSHSHSLTVSRFGFLRFVRLL